LLAFPSFPEAPAGFAGFGAFQDSDQVRVCSGASFLHERAVAIELLRQERIIFSELGQTVDDLNEARVDFEEVLVCWQLHALGPPASSGCATGAAIP
jgi:hypothetical protein